MENQSNGGRRNVPAESDPLAARRIGAVSSFLLDREPLLPALAAHLGGREEVFESAIRGSSMSPAIPSLARLRVRLLADRRCRPGDIVYFLSNDGFMVHRVIRQLRDSSTASHLLTFGDNCLSPDPPVRMDRILGIVVAVRIAGDWRPPGPPINASVIHRAIRAASATAVIVAFRFSAAAARRLVAALTALESVGRAPIGRLLRSLHLIPSGRQ